MYGWMDESPHCGYLRPINASDKNSTDSSTSTLLPNEEETVIIDFLDVV